ncbi:TerD family protein [Acinetobacter sp. c3-l95]|uniref:TerD family protein n=1 Tax=Acinetobacter sp. c3-l95 TaxID=3342804 RepID=UPI0035B913B5
MSIRPKLSALITAMRLYQIKRDDKAILVRIKPKENHSNLPAKSNANTANIASQEQKTLILNNKIEIIIRTAFDTDAVLWRLNTQQKVRGDHDMIFYGQTDSEDNTLSFNVEHDNQHILSQFSCDLSKQQGDVQKMAFSLSSEQAIPPQNIQVMINQNNICLFQGDFLIQQPNQQSVILFELMKQSNDWRFMAKKQTFNQDLRALCEHYGIEVSDD